MRMLAIALVVTAVTSMAQTATGEIRGQVGDPAGQLTSSMRGLIVDPTLARVANATVEAVSSEARFVTTTDGMGEFYFPNLQPSSYAIRVQGLGFFPATVRGIVLRGGEMRLVPAIPLMVGEASCHRVAFVLEAVPAGRTGEIRGTLLQQVYGTADRTALAKAPVEVAQDFGRETIQQTATDQMGLFRFVALPPGRYWLRIRETGVEFALVVGEWDVIMEPVLARVHRCPESGCDEEHFPVEPVITVC